jgi:predicted nuclease of predicted toxin-antitoxin system
LNFLVDAQLPPALARWISGRGHRAIHVFEIGLHTATDSDIWDQARAEDAIIISKDEDFVARSLLSERPVALLWIRKGNCSNQALIGWFEPLWPETLARLEQGEQLVELRG